MKNKSANVNTCQRCVSRSISCENDSERDVAGPRDAVQSASNNNHHNSSTSNSNKNTNSNNSRISIHTTNKTIGERNVLRDKNSIDNNIAFSLTRNKLKEPVCDSPSSVHGKAHNDDSMELYDMNPDFFQIESSSQHRPVQIEPDIYDVSFSQSESTQLSMPQNLPEVVHRDLCVCSTGDDYPYFDVHKKRIYVLHLNTGIFLMRKKDYLDPYQCPDCGEKYVYVRKAYTHKRVAIVLPRPQSRIRLHLKPCGKTEAPVPILRCPKCDAPSQQMITTIRRDRIGKKYFIQECQKCSWKKIISRHSVNPKTRFKDESQESDQSRG